MITARLGPRADFIKVANGARDALFGYMRDHEPLGPILLIMHQPDDHRRFRLYTNAEDAPGTSATESVKRALAYVLDQLDPDIITADTDEKGQIID